MERVRLRARTYLAPEPVVMAAACFLYGLALGLLIANLLDWAAARIGDYLHARHQRRTR